MLVRVHVEHAGRGPTKARTYLHEDIVTSVLEDALTPVEKTLAGDGQTDTVGRVRHKLQQAMRNDMVRQVEASTGRSIRVFLSANELDPDVAVETFLLEPVDAADEQLDRGRKDETRSPRGRDLAWYEPTGPTPCLLIAGAVGAAGAAQREHGGRSERWRPLRG